MEGWICRRSTSLHPEGPHPYSSFLDECQALHPGLPHLGSTGRESVEGGAPYLHEYGLPQYAPDEHDTALTVTSRTTEIDKK